MRYRGGAGALCVADAGTRRRFASDLLNLTLAAPAVNRHRKSGKDAGEWLPRVSRCWLAARVVADKRKYRLTVDARGPDPWAAVRGPWSGSTGRASSGIESRVTATRAGPVAAR